MNVDIPPRSLNHRLPAACDAPTATPASSLLSPFAISRQNNRSTSRRCVGCPGDFIGALPVNSLIHPAGLPINTTSTITVLRGPVESAQLASTMIELSRGWQLRNPVDVRGEELLAALARKSPVASGGMVSLGADVLFTQRLREVTASDLPEPMATALPRLVNVSSIYESLLEREVIPDQGGRAAAAAWAQKFADLSARLHADGASATDTRIAAHAAILADLAPEIVRLAPAQDLDAWLPRSDGDIAAAPYLSRYRAVIFARLRNAGSRWEGNDLIDLNFLCGAAGYADVVVGESRTIGDLRTATGLPPGAGALLATSLAEAVSLLR